MCTVWTVADRTSWVVLPPVRESYATQLRDDKGREVPHRRAAIAVGEHLVMDDALEHDRGRGIRSVESERRRILFGKIRWVEFGVLAKFALRKPGRYTLTADVRYWTGPWQNEAKRYIPTILPPASIEIDVTESDLTGVSDGTPSRKNASPPSPPVHPVWAHPERVAALADIPVPSAAFSRSVAFATAFFALGAAWLLARRGRQAKQARKLLNGQ